MLQVKNNAHGILNADITADDTSLTLQTGEGANFPDPPFHITVDDEIMEVTAVNGDTFTITRGVEGTTATAHSAGAVVHLNLTAEIIKELQDSPHCIAFEINGGGSAIQPGVWGCLRIPFSCEIQSVSLGAPLEPGSIQIDIWKSTHANFPPDDADSICGGNEPAISSGQKYEDTTLSGWTKTINAGDWLVFNVDSCTDITLVTIALKVRKT